MNIEIKCRLSAYSKGALPDLSKVVLEAPEDNEIYARKNKEWVKANEIIPTNTITIPDLPNPQDSGLIIETEDNIHYTIRVNQELIDESDFIKLQNLKDNTIYYVIENLVPELFIDGGNAFSDGNNEYVIENQYNVIYDCGKSNTEVYQIHIKGVTHGN